MLQYRGCRLASEAALLQLSTAQTCKLFEDHSSSSSDRDGGAFFQDGAWWGVNESLAAEAAAEEACKWFVAGAEVIGYHIRRNEEDYLVLLRNGDLGRISPRYINKSNIYAIDTPTSFYIICFPLFAYWRVCTFRWAMPALLGRSESAHLISSTTTSKLR